jgi:hypothetical protein
MTIYEVFYKLYIYQLLMDSKIKDLGINMLCTNRWEIHLKLLLEYLQE